MIVSRIEGGLGNQMFQYAYGWYLARRHRCPLQLDLQSYEAGPAHGYLLDKFQITAPAADPQTLQRLPRRYRPSLAGHDSGQRLAANGRAVGRWAVGRWAVGWRGLFRRRLRRHKESPFGFHPRHLRVGSGRYVVGYWQSAAFFPGIREELLEQFRPRQPLSPRSQELWELLRGTHSLALHVRRGDYRSDPAAAKLYYPVDEAYYRRVLESWARGATAAPREPQVFIFSNDMAWCRRKFDDLPWTTHFVDHTTAATAHEDMLLMSAAQCCAIANSTFSWWAAWLNPRADAVVYAPRPWFQPHTLDSRHIVPAEWQVVDARPAEAG